MKQNTAPTFAGASFCSACNLGERWILHHLHHRKSYRLVCTSCVLKLNVTAFCPICFELHHRPRKYSAPAPPPDHRGTLSCFKCTSISHGSCVAPNAPKSPYLCPTCINPNSRLFDFTKSRASKAQNQAIDLKSAKILLAAALIAANSVNDAADQARIDAERKAKEAVFARKRTKDALDRVAVLWSHEMERMKMREGNGGSLFVPVSVSNQSGLLGLMARNVGAVSDDLQRDFERVDIGRQSSSGANAVVDGSKSFNNGGLSSGSQHLQGNNF